MEGIGQEIFKIIVVGDSNVGKTSIAKRYCDQNFIEYYRVTPGIDLKKKTVNFNDKTIILHIWDTAGSEKYQSLVQLYYRGAMGLLLVYDVTSLDSFHNLDTWLKNIDDFAPPHVVKILIGSKCDLESERKVSTDDGKLVAEHLGIPFFEVSSKNNVNIDDLFLTMVSMINNVNIEIAIEKDFVILSHETPVSCDKSKLPKCNC